MTASRSTFRNAWNSVCLSLKFCPWTSCYVKIFDPEARAESCLPLMDICRIADFQGFLWVAQGLWAIWIRNNLLTFGLNYEDTPSTLRNQVWCLYCHVQISLVIFPGCLPWDHKPASDQPEPTTWSSIIWSQSSRSEQLIFQVSILLNICLPIEQLHADRAIAWLHKLWPWTSRRQTCWTIGGQSVQCAVLKYCWMYCMFQVVSILS